MSCFSKNAQIISVEPLNENEDIENIVHAFPIYDVYPTNVEHPVIFMVPNLVITQDQRRIPYKYKIISTSVILCCFSIIIITIAVNSINRNNYQSIPKNSIGNYSSVRL